MANEITSIQTHHAKYLVKVLEPDGGEINGTGFLCLKEGFVLTCYHVVEPYIEKACKDVRIDFKDEEYSAEICTEYCLKESDIAVLKITDFDQTGTPLRLDIYDRWHTGDEIYTVGHPMGHFEQSGISCRGEIGCPTKDKEDVNIVQITGDNIENIEEGFSGAPVLHKRTNRAIGLICATYEGRSCQAFFVPLTPLINRWPQLREANDVFKQFRIWLKEDAQRECEKRLNKTEFIPLSWECGTIAKDESHRRQEEQDGRPLTRQWQDIDSQKLLPPERNYILSSNVGTGKTTLLYHLAGELVDKTEYLPLFVKCGEVEESGRQWWSALRKIIVNRCESGFPKQEQDILDCLDEYFKNGKTVFLFDGLDQISGQEYLPLVEAIFAGAGSNKVLIGSRPSAVKISENDPAVVFLRLKPFSTGEQKKYFGADYDKASKLSAFAPDLTCVPMLAYMVRLLIKKNENRRHQDKD